MELAWISKGDWARAWDITYHQSPIMLTGQSRIKKRASCVLDSGIVIVRCLSKDKSMRSDAEELVQRWKRLVLGESLRISEEIQHPWIIHFQQAHHLVRTIAKSAWKVVSIFILTSWRSSSSKTRSNERKKKKIQALSALRSWAWWNAVKPPELLKWHNF